MALTDNSLAISSVLPTAGTGSNVTFNIVSRDATGTRRRADTSDAADPYDLIIRHSQSGSVSKDNLVERHLVQVATIKHETTNVERLMTVGLTIAKPHSTLFNTAAVQARIAEITNLLLTSGYLDALLRGEA